MILRTSVILRIWLKVCSRWAVVPYIEAQFNFCDLTGEGFDLGIVDVDLQIRQVGQNVFEHADAIDDLDADLNRVGGGAVAVLGLAAIPTDGDEAIARYVIHIGTALAVDDNAATAQGHTRR
jgi:hypothetical protein